MLADIIRDYTDQPVYALAFHVDYWNQLGWQDRFSNKRYTERQRRYAETRGMRTYTPQMIINGRTEFNGRLREKADRAISRSLRRRATASIRLSVELDEPRQQVLVSYELATRSENLQLHVALVEHAIESAISRGENRGRTLQHCGVVRRFRTFATTGAAAGQTRIELPANANLAQCHIVAYAQRPGSLRVVGAAQTPDLAALRD